MNLADFLGTYNLRPPGRPADNPDENRQLSGSDGVLELSGAPVAAGERLVPEKKGDPGCHLWVVVPGRVPYILERAVISPPLTSGVAKHSNLTGGGLAVCGGELWVDPVDDARVYLNGCSGRYAPRSRGELEDVEALLVSMGLAVTSFGWDNDAGRPAMVLRR